MSETTETINGEETNDDIEGKAIKAGTGTTLKGALHAVAIALSVWMVAFGGSLVGYGLSAPEAPSWPTIVGIAALGIGAICSVLGVHFAQKRGEVRDRQANDMLLSLNKKVAKSAKASGLQAREIAQLSLSIDKLRILPMPDKPQQPVSTTLTQLPIELQGWKRVRAGVKYICSH